MKTKYKTGTLRRWLASLLCAAAVCSAAAMPAFAQDDIAQALNQAAALPGEDMAAENSWSLTDLQNQFPQGRYWNHVDNPGYNNNDPMHTSSKPCTSHGSKGYNSDTCNHPTFGNYYCCWGYADQLGYLYSGSNPERWTKLQGSNAYNYINNLKTGDIVRFRFNSGAEHSMFVTSTTSDRVYYTDCNVDGKCGISWSRSQTKDYFRENNRVLWVQVCPGQNVDTEPPVISNVQVTNLTSNGYDVSCTVTDNVGVNRVVFPTWTAYNDQDDIAQSWWDANNSSVRGTRNGNTWSFHVSIADHNNEHGTYYTHIYAYDDEGNYQCNTDVGAVTVPGPDTEWPSLGNWKVFNVTSEGFDTSVVSIDNVGVDRVILKSWTNNNDVVESRMSRAGDVYTGHVSIHDHGDRRGTYYINITSYDAAGNYGFFVNDREVVVPEENPTITFDANGGTAEFTSKQIDSTSVYGALPEAWMDGYIFDGWFTEVSGGTRVSSSTAYSDVGSVTLYAHWIPVASDAQQGWALQNGTLVISVQGAMQDYNSARETPWFSNRAEIKKIVVQNGVTSIGDYAFYGCENVTSVSLPGTLTQIGKLSFYGCKNLTSLDLPASVTMVEDYAFAKSGLQQLTFRGSASVLGAGIFADLKLNVRYPSGDASWSESVRQNYAGVAYWNSAAASELSMQDDDLQLDDPVLEALLDDSCV